MQAFTRQLQASAAQAAQAAQTLASTATNLDAMAATDAYVQSEGYNVAASQRKRLSPPENQAILPLNELSSASSSSTQIQMHVPRNAQTQSLTPHDVVPLKVDANLPDREFSLGIDPVKKVHQPYHEHDTQRTLFRNGTGRQNTKAHNSNIRNQNDDDQSSSSDDSDDNDPVLSYSRVQRQESSLLKAVTTSDINSQKKNPRKANRFMDDLESRMAMPTEQTQGYSKSSNRDDDDITGIFASGNSQSGGKVSSWIPTFLSGSIASMGAAQEETVAANQMRAAAAKRAPLARGRQHQPQNASSPNDRSDDVILVSSTVLLGESELEELTQLHRRQQAHESASTSIEILIGTIECGTAALMKHPREFFILFTLLLFLTVYYFSSNHSQPV